MCLCNNSGICAPHDECLGQEQERSCLCPEGSSGITCEQLSTKITVSFAPEIRIPPAILVHFIQVFGKKEAHIQMTIPKKIPIDEETVFIFRNEPFHIVFIEIEPKTYYSSVLQEEYVPIN